MRDFLILIGLTILMSSCSFQGSLQGLFPYQRTYVKETPHLFTYTDECSPHSLDYSPQSVLILNGETLRKCMGEEKTLIHTWKPNCTAKACILIEIIQNICDDLNIKLYIVAEYYDGDKMSMNYDIEHKLMAIDNRYYRTAFVDSQLKKFFSDLTKVKDFKDIRNNYFLFENREFIESYQSLDTFIEDIESQISQSF